MDDYRGLSLWLDTLPEPIVARPALGRDLEVDVAIVGAGYSGLWTAYYLSHAAPGLRVAVLEAEVAGFGASGRNGGWVTAGLMGIAGLLAKPGSREKGMALQRAMFDTVDEVGRVCEAEGIDAHYQKGGSFRLASLQSHRHALQAEAAHLAECGFSREDFAWLEPEECKKHLQSARCFGGLFTPHCAVVQPARLARGLAACVEARGVQIFERTPVTQIESGRVKTASATVRAKVVVRATEAYTHTLRGYERALIPLHSMMIATEPLPETVWKEIGLGQRETFGDNRRVTIYGQRTADDRLAFGSRATYRFMSGVESRFEPDDPRFAATRREMTELLPVLSDAKITHRWGGALGVPRNWRPSVGLDRERGLGWLGGYVGEGVAASNLAGRTLAELIARADTERVRLAWVGPPSANWEREPFRSLGVWGVTRIGEAADRAEFEGRRPPRIRSALFRAMVDH